MNAVMGDVLTLPATQRLLWRGAMYEALALSFTYPDGETLADLAAALDALRAHEVTAGWEGRAALDALAVSLASGSERLAPAHTSLFAGEAACSTAETEYDFDAFAKARRLADIAGFYRAFGLKVAAERPGPADFVATELEFMSHLLMRQAFAAVNGWDEQRDVCEQAQRAFLEDHLGRWAALFCQALQGLDGCEPFYATAAALCDEFVRAEIDATGVRPRPAIPRRPSPDEAGPFTCMFAAPENGEEEGQP